MKSVTTSVFVLLLVSLVALSQAALSDYSKQRFSELVKLSRQSGLQSSTLDEYKTYLNEFLLGYGAPGLINNLTMCESYITVMDAHFAAGKDLHQKGKHFDGWVEYSMALGNFSVALDNCVYSSASTIMEIEDYISKFSSIEQFTTLVQASMTKNALKFGLFMAKYKKDIAAKNYTDAAFVAGEIVRLLLPKPPAKLSVAADVSSVATLFKGLNNVLDFTIDFLAATKIISNPTNMNLCKTNLDSFLIKANQGVEMIENPKTRLTGILTFFDSFQQLYGITMTCGEVIVEWDEATAAHNDILKHPLQILHNIQKHWFVEASDAMGAYSCLFNKDLKCLAKMLGDMTYWALFADK